MVYIFGEEEKPPLDELVHYGVKGMKWGVRRSREELAQARKKSEEPGSKKVSDKQWKDAVKQTTPKHATKEDKQKAIKQDEKLFLNKFKGDASTGGPPSKKDEGGFLNNLSNKQKAQLALGAAATAAIVGAYGYQIYQQKKTYAEGDKISPFAFMVKVDQSKQASWGGDYLSHPSVWEQGEVTFPAGHVFHRISDQAETKFGKATYSTASDADFRRYLYGFAAMETGGAAGKYHITFQAKEDIRVPTLAQRLAAVHTAMQRDYPEQKWTAKDAADQYQKWIGKSWTSEGSQSFFKVLKEQGFDAIVDDMDAGVIGEIPLVIFNHDKFTSKTATKMTSDFVKEQGKYLTEISNRKT